jgi:hypothetical protein
VSLVWAVLLGASLGCAGRGVAGSDFVHGTVVSGDADAGLATAEAADASVVVPADVDHPDIAHLADVPDTVEPLPDVFVDTGWSPKLCPDGPVAPPGEVGGPPVLGGAMEQFMAECVFGSPGPGPVWPLPYPVGSFMSWAVDSASGTDALDVDLVILWYTPCPRQFGGFVTVTCPLGCTCPPEPVKTELLFVDDPAANQGGVYARVTLDYCYELDHVFAPSFVEVTLIDAATGDIGTEAMWYFATYMPAGYCDLTLRPFGECEDLPDCPLP